MCIKNLVSRSQTATVDGGLGDVHYTAPGSLYPYAWGWDAAVHAMGYSYFNIDRALEELKASVGGQAANGMIPHITFYNHTPDKRYYPGPASWRHHSRHGVPISGISQPPLMGTAIAHIVDRIREDPSLSLENYADQLHVLIDAALAYHRWWYAERDLHGTGVVVSTHPWETGMDNSGAWIAALERVPLGEVEPYTRVDVKPDGSNQHERPTDRFYDQATALLQYQRDHGQYSFLDPNGALVAERVAGQAWQMGDIGLNAILQNANHALSRVAEALGRPSAEQDEIASWIARSQSGIEDLLWNEERGVYVSYDFVAQAQVPVVTSGSFLALFGFCGDTARRAKMAHQLERWVEEKQVRYLVPSTSPEEELFNPTKYWLGPVWPHVNTMIAQGLHACGHSDTARRVVKDTLELLEEHGLKEYFNPLETMERGQPGRGLGAGDFGFSSAVYPQLLEMAEQLDIQREQATPSSDQYAAAYAFVKCSL